MARPEPEEAPEAQRLDRWLWHARFARTRSAAQKLVSGGHVRLNKQKVVQPSRAVRIGDVLTVALAGRVRVAQVKGFSEKRVSFPQAQALYEDLSPPREKPAPGAEKAAPPSPARPGHKPDTRQRRQLIALKQRLGKNAG